MIRQQRDLFDSAPPDVPGEVIEMFERFTLEAIAGGMTRYSARAVLHRIRWHHHVERGDREFKVNNNCSAGLARWFMAAHPEHDGVFETRASRAEEP